MRPVNLSVKAQTMKEKERIFPIFFPEMETILTEVELRKDVLFSWVSCGVAGERQSEGLEGGDRQR